MSVIRGTTITTPLARTAVTDDTAVSKKPWSSKNTVDKLCPSFSERGAVAVCNPIKDYPLEVVSTINAKPDGSAWESITLTHCGKNLFPDGDLVHIGSAAGYKTLILERPIPPGEYVISLVSYTQTPASTNGYAPVIVTKYEDGSDGPAMYCQYHSSYATAVKFTKPVTRIQFWSNTYSTGSSKGVSADLYGVQIEPGKVRTDYETYELFNEQTVDVGGVVSGIYNWTTGVLTNEDGDRG